MREHFFTWPYAKLWKHVSFIDHDNRGRGRNKKQVELATGNIVFTETLYPWFLWQGTLNVVFITSGWGIKCQKVNRKL